MDEIARLIAALTPRQRLALAERLTGEQPGEQPIAVIGMAGRFPGAGDLDAFWRLLEKGGHAISEVPSDRWDVEAFYSRDPSAAGKMSTRWGGFLTEVDGFDAGFFGISPREARHMDPQQRLALEVAFEALEDAGQSPARLSGSQTGVFMGATHFDHAFHGFGDLSQVGGYELAGNLLYSISGRISYFLNARGPSVVLDTACSSSLAAVHLACQSLRRRETSVALAGGVNLILHPALTVAFSKAGAMSPKGRCKSFDAAADGFVRGEGCGVVVLKRQAEALRDGDPIHALIRGTALQHGGHSAGYTVPNVLSQVALLESALREAGVRAAQVGCLEPHATGTALGDPIELEALAKVYGERRPDSRPCVIGSAKPNIGHLESAAGIAGLIKAVLSLRREAVPGLAHFKSLNPHAALGETRFVFSPRLSPWPRGPEKRFAAVSSFGISGTIAHAVLEEGPALPQDDHRPESGEGYLLALSARCPEALKALAREHRAALQAGARHESLRDLCYTAGTRRAHHEHRVALAFRTRPELARKLASFEEGRPLPGVSSGEGGARKARVAFVYCGQGAHWAGMGLGLLDRELVFRSTLEDCDRIFRGLAGWSLLERLTARGQASRLEDTETAQPLLFALQAGLTALWRSWGVDAAAAVGHSAGEIAAAYAGGILSLEDSLRVAYHRGRLMQGASDMGKMAAVALSPEEARAAIAGHAGRLWVAAVNAPRAAVLSGDAQALAEVARSLEGKGLFVKTVHERYAFHSHQMEPFAKELTASLKGLRPQPARIEVFSTLTGAASRPEDFGAEYWGRNIREPVLFAEAAEKLLAAGYETVVEVGPHPVLSADLAQCRAQAERGRPALPSLRRGQDEQATMLASLGALYALGHPVRFEKLYPSGRCLSLPSYPWQREAFSLRAAAAPRQEPGKTVPLYEIRWQERALARARRKKSSEERGRWLILADRQGVGAALKARLEAEGRGCVMAFRGEGYLRSGSGTYRLDARKAGDFKRLLKDSFGVQPCLGVVHLWSLDAPRSQRSTARSLDIEAELGVHSVLHLVQGLASAALAREPRLWLVTRRAVAADSAGVCAGQAPVWGLGRVIMREHPGLRCALVDLGSERDARALFEELLGAGGQDQVALRGEKRYVARLAEHRAKTGSFAARGEATYLIAGGLGALGLRTGRWLVERGARHIVLAGRRPASARARRDVDAMRALGARVLTVKADVSRKREVAKLLAGIERSMPALKGIIHAAGTLDDALLTGLNARRLRAVMAAKAAGAWNLHQLSQRRPLDFFVLFSSAASILGGIGRGNYAAANAFLDGLAHHRRSLGLKALAINWGGWAQTGMAAELRERLPRLGQSLPLIAADRGLETLGRLLAASGPAQVLAVSFDLRDWGLHDQSPPPSLLGQVLREEEDRRTGAAQSSVREALRACRPEDRRAFLEAYVRSLLAGVLQVSADAVDLRRPLTDLGLDSIVAVELGQQAQKDLGVSVGPAGLLGGLTPAGLAQDLLGKTAGG